MAWDETEHASLAGPRHGVSFPTPSARAAQLLARSSSWMDSSDSGQAGHRYNTRCAQVNEG
eukprot:scaffold123256_cov32-Tisochrysis_lutea.AAC.3